MELILSANIGHLTGAAGATRGQQIAAMQAFISGLSTGIGGPDVLEPCLAEYAGSDADFTERMHPRVRCFGCLTKQCNASIATSSPAMRAARTLAKSTCRAYCRVKMEVLLVQSL